MDLLVVVDGVTDYDAWRKVFDEDEPERAKFAASMEACLLYTSPSPRD